MGIAMKARIERPMVYVSQPLLSWKPTISLIERLYGQGLDIYPDLRRRSREWPNLSAIHDSKVFLASSTDPHRGQANEVKEALTKDIPIVALSITESSAKENYLPWVPYATHFKFQGNLDSFIEDVSNAILLLTQPPRIQIQLESPSAIILVDSQKHWDEIFEIMAAQPTLLHKMESREFEEFVAELLEKEGFNVQLTKKTRDGGRDILAYHESVLGNHLTYIECKRYAPERRVGVELVHRLYGVAQGERATASALITTSAFTKSAKDWAKPLSHQISLRDFDFLATWLAKLRQSAQK